MRNVDIRLRLDQEGILDVAKRRQDKWKKRLEEMNDDRTKEKVFKGELEGRDLEVDRGEGDCQFYIRQQPLSNYSHMTLLCL